MQKEGIKNYRELQKENVAPYNKSDISVEDKLLLQYMGKTPKYQYDGWQTIKSPMYNTGTKFGESSYDPDLINQTDLDVMQNNPNEIRALNQPWYAKVTNGLAKGVILAGTTFLDGTVGLVTGIDEAFNRKGWSGLWDNDFSRLMQTVNEISEQELPNYYSTQETEEPWYENVFTANFLGDKFIKNLGFTVGAFYSGGVFSAALKATKIPQLMGTLAKAAKFAKASEVPKMVLSGAGAAMSAVNEGRIEALNNSKQWFEDNKRVLDVEHLQRVQAIKDQYGDTAEASILIQDEIGAYNEALGKLTEDRLKMGNMDLLFNIPILTASNLFQFAKLYANGFKSSRRAVNILKRDGKFGAATTKLGATAAITRGALSEGTEEITQGMASNIAGHYYTTDVNNFYKAKTDREAEQETLDWAKSFAHGINETVNDGSAWEEFAIGAITGALGMPSFRSIKSESGSLQSPITLKGGAINEWREYKDKIKREQDIANYMNNRMQSPEFKNYYQGLIRHNKYQKDMDKATEDGDAFEFKNAEHAQLVSDILTFDNAGRLEELKGMIGEAFDTSDENLDAIVRNTTTIDENGKLVGPFADWAVKEKDGSISSNFGNEESKQKMISELTKNKDDIFKTIKQYQEIREKLDINTGQQLSDEQLEELTWMQSQLDNWSERAVSMSGEVKSAISDVIGNLDSLLRFNQQVRDFEGQSHADLTDRYKQADKNVKAIEGAINTLNMARGQDDKVLAHTLATNPKFVDGLIKEINEVDETVLSADEKADITTKLNDIVKLGNASKTYNAKLKEYLESPQKQAEDHARADEQAAQQETKTKTNNLKDALKSATNLSEFKAALANQDELEFRDKVLKELEDEGNELAKDYRETTQYNDEVARAINESDADPQTKQDALQLLQDQFNNSENLKELANPNSVYVNNENAFDEVSENAEESANRFLEAQYELQKAMSKINNDNRFKDRFSEEYKKPVEKREGNVKGDNRTTTGDSQTTTVPSVESSEGLPTIELPVGDVTAETIQEENKELNENAETQQKLDETDFNQFYRPAIPELHIEASKEGDFRPFDVVVKEREKGVDFSIIYNYLRDSGAFKYVNEGNLKAGDELGFMIDLRYEEKVAGQPWHKQPTIFIIDKRNGQVVGSLDESDYSVSRYEGLKGLEEKIRREYAERGSQSSKPSSDEIKNFIIEETIKYYRDVIGNPLTKESIDTMNKTPLSGLYTSTYASSLLKDSAFRNKVDNFAKSTNQKSKFIATPTTRVSKIMIGKIPYNNTERSLSEIPNVSSTDRRPIFGIIKNGVLTTNSKIDDSLIIKPVDMNQKEGRLYLFIPNGAGKYSPAAVRVKHFNKEEFNLEDSSISSTAIGEDIKNAINKLSTATSQDDVSAAMQDLSQDLYMQDIMVTWFSSKAGDGIVISKKVRKPDGTYEKVIIEGKEQIKEDKYDVYFSTSSKSAKIGEIGGVNFDVAPEDLEDTSALSTPKNPENIYNEILGHLTKFNLPLQVSARRINEGAYNNRLINSNILTSNITEASIRSNWFTMDYFDKEGKLHPAINPISRVSQSNRSEKSPVGGAEGAIRGTRIVSTFSNKPYYVDLTTNTIRDDQGRTIEITDKNRILFDLAWAQDNFGDAANSSKMVDNKVVTPDGKVLDRSKQVYLSGQEAQDVKDAINRIKKKEKVSQTVEGLPIFNTSLDAQNPIEDLTPEHSMNNVDEGVGYFELDGKLHKGYLTPVIGIPEVSIHITKVPNITRGFGRPGEAAHVASNSFYAVFPNGKTFLLVRNNPIKGGMSQKEIEKVFTERLSANMKKVYEFSSEKTILFDPDNIPPADTTPNTTKGTPISTTKEDETKTGAAYTIQKEQAINNKKASRSRHKLRKVESLGYEKWDEKKELKWLNKVLPLLSEQDRVKVVKGLIKVGKRGTLAWGQFDKGVITLSDIAAEGTVYHEAFHVVFNLLLDNNERQSLYDEARRLYGEKDNLSLEEDMAEGFREYVTTRQNAGLLGKIKNFFKDLWIKVTNWNSIRPHLTAYYQMINRGEYSNRELPVETLSQAKARQEEYSKEMQDILANAKRDSEGNLLAPNGRPTNLTERQYAQVRTKAFKDWFGDWENNPENASKVVDENGEPLVVYHGGAKGITKFKTSTEEESNTGYGYYTNLNTGEKIPLDSNRTMFFSSNPHVGRSYADLYAINILKRARIKINDILLHTPENSEAVKLTTKHFPSIQDVYDLFETLAEFNPRFTNLLNYVKKLQAKGQKMRGPKNINEMRKMLIDVREQVEAASDNWLMVGSQRENGLARGNKIINTYNTSEGRKALKNGEIPESIKREWDIYEKIKKNRASQGLEKIGNYNNIYVYLNDGNYILIYDGKSLKFREGFSTKDVKDMTDKEIKNFFDEAKAALHRDYKAIRQEADRKRLIEKSGFYSVFLNIKNPLIHDYEGTHQGQGYKESPKYQFGYVAARQVNKAIKEGNDGVVYQNLYDPYLADNYGVFNPNQIKSATDNVGTFSRTNDDIRYREVPNSSFKSLSEEVQENLLKKGWTAEKFDSISQEERDQAVKCIAF